MSIDAYGNAAKDSHLVNIGLDDESGGYQMVKYLLECGYEHIKVCAGRDNGVDHLRYVGAQRAMQECAAEGQKLQFVALGMNYEKRKQVMTGWYREDCRERHCFSSPICMHWKRSASVLTKSSRAAADRRGRL